MNFEQFNKLICDQIGVPATARYGSIGIQYLKVVIFQDGKFLEVGELLYKIWSEGLYTEQDLINFGKECEDFRLGLMKKMPSWCYKETDNEGGYKLSFYDYL